MSESIEVPGQIPMVFVCILMPTLIGDIACVAVIFVDERVLHYVPARPLGTL